MNVNIPLPSSTLAKQPSKCGSSGQSTESSPTKKCPVLGREQAKKRLLAFTQQINKVKDVQKDELGKRVSNESKGFKFTFLVNGLRGEEKSFPLQLLKYTKTEPVLSYSESPSRARGVFKGRREIFETSDASTKKSMEAIINSGTPINYGYMSHKSRCWFVDKSAFVGHKTVSENVRNKPVLQIAEQYETIKNLEHCSPVRQFERYSPHWETDSEEETGREVERDEALLDLIPFPEKPVEIKLVPKISKVKINKIELPFFEDDDLLESLISGEMKVKEEKQATNVAKHSEDTEVEDEIPLLLPTISKPKEKPDTIAEKEAVVEEAVDSNKDDYKQASPYDKCSRKRRSASPIWLEDIRKEARIQRESERRCKQDLKTAARTDMEKPEDIYPPFLNDFEIKSEDTITNSGVGSSQDDGTDKESVVDSKRISLDERLELELGIKMEVDQENIVPPLPDQYYNVETTPPGSKRRGFGPKAAPLGPLIFLCPAALPPAPFIPVHLQSLLYRPLVFTPKPTSSSLPQAEETENDKAGLMEDWEIKLRNLEAAANNLEAADETVLEALEEQLLLLEAMNTVPSKDESPPPTAQPTNNRPKHKRPKPKPVELKAAGKSILVMPRVNLFDEGTSGKKKNVMFADSVKPGEGTSSEEEEELRSPPPPTEIKVTKKEKKPKIRDDFDPEYDLLPPPPPPPGSPPPHLPQGKPPPLLLSSLAAAAVIQPDKSNETGSQSPESCSPPPPPPGEADELL